MTPTTISPNTNDQVMHNLDFFAELHGLNGPDIERGREILERFNRFSASALNEANLDSHLQGLSWVDGDALYPQVTVDLFSKYAGNGFIGMSASEALGGSAMPNALQPLFAIMGFKHNPQFYLKEMVTTSAINALSNVIDQEQDAQKRAMLENITRQIMSGEYTGAMVLTEPKGGSNLGSEMETSIGLQDEGVSISGVKNFITGMSTGGTKATNVISLVVSITRDADGEIMLDKKRRPMVSVALVPKYKIDAQGNTLQPRQENGITISEPYRKPGIEPQILTAVEYDKSEGILLGEAGKGWNVMFGIMNPARLKVAAQGVAAAQEAFERSAEFATSRGADTRLGQPISFHPQMLARLKEMRATAEFGAALLMEAGLVLDQSKDVALTKEERGQKQALLELMTPMLKAYMTERGKYATKLAVDVTSGRGYTSLEIPKMRADIEPSTFYEGTNQMMARAVATKASHSIIPGTEITAMDAYLAQARASIEESPPSDPSTQLVHAAINRLEEEYRWLAGVGEQQQLAASESFTLLFGDVAMGVTALRTRDKAAQHLKEGVGAAASDALATRIDTAEFFIHGVLRRQLEPEMRVARDLIPHLQPTADIRALEEAQLKKAQAEADRPMTAESVRQAGAEYPYKLARGA